MHEQIWLRSALSLMPRADETSLPAASPPSLPTIEYILPGGGNANVLLALGVASLMRGAYLTLRAVVGGQRHAAPTAAAAASARSPAASV